jgi:hypothetical protein
MSLFDTQKSRQQFEEVYENKRAKTRETNRTITTFKQDRD